MYTYMIEDMTCKHCERAIRNEIEDLDAEAQVTVDLETKMVQVQSQQSSAKISEAISEAGFSVKVLS